MNHPEYMKVCEFYRMCPIEVDAEYYARHHGRIKMNPMDVIRLSTLNEAEEHGAITEILARLSMVFGDPMF
jgi:hypothetical protein